MPDWHGRRELGYRESFHDVIMSFDKNSTLPLVDPHKPSTKVNFSIVIAVVVFLAIAAGAVWWLSEHSPNSAPSQGPSSSNP